MIEALGLTKRYGDVEAIRDVSFEVPRDTIVGLLGPNGAGKSTAMKIITCFMPPTSGTARVSGHDIFEDPMAVKRSIGYLPEHPPVYPDLTVEEQVVYAAQLKGVPWREQRQAAAAAMEKVGVEGYRRRLVRHLSKGYQQRVGIAQALVHSPPVLILDEPTVGLDPSQIREIRKRIQELGKAHTVILSTHILPEVSLTCSRVIIIDRGRIAAQGTPEELARQVLGSEFLRLVLSGTGGGTEELLAEVEGVVGIERDPDHPPGAEESAFRLRIERGRDPRAELSRLAREKSWTILELRPPGLTLEEVFLHVTSRDQPPGLDPTPPTGALS